MHVCTQLLVNTMCECMISVTAYGDSDAALDALEGQTFDCVTVVHAIHSTQLPCSPAFGGSL